MLKTNYWSQQVSSLNEASRRNLKGDGIPCVRRIIPKARYPSEKTIKQKHGMSILNYLIRKSKETPKWQKNSVGVNSDFPAELLFTPQIDKNGDKDSIEKFNSRNWSLGNPNYDQILDMYNTNIKDYSNK